MALWANYKLKKKGLTGIKYSECINPLKHFSVLLGFLLYILIPQHIFEQYVIRFYDDYCRQTCLLNNDGKCIECGCNTAAKMWSPLEADSRNNWGKIIFSKKKYYEHRNNYPIKIQVKFLKNGSI